MTTVQFLLLATCITVSSNHADYREGLYCNWNFVFVNQTIMSAIYGDGVYSYIDVTSHLMIAAIPQTLLSLMEGLYMSVLAWWIFKVHVKFSPTKLLSMRDRGAAIHTYEQLVRLMQCTIHNNIQLLSVEP